MIIFGGGGGLFPWGFSVRAAIKFLDVSYRRRAGATPESPVLPATSCAGSRRGKNIAEIYFKKRKPVEFYDRFFIPALAMAEQAVT